jgi:hypothetical protein
MYDWLIEEASIQADWHQEIAEALKLVMNVILSKHIWCSSCAPQNMN